MASYPNLPHYAASGAGMSRDGSWQSRPGADMSRDGSWQSRPGADMERCFSGSTDRTAGSNYTTHTSYSAHSSATAYSTHDFIFPKDEADQGPLSYPDPPAVYELQDLNHFLSATGDQFSQEPCPSSPLEPFTTKVGREDAAWQATHAAHIMITNPQLFWNTSPSFITAEAVDEAIQGYREQGVDEPARPGVQDVLSQHLYVRFRAIEPFSYPEIGQILKEAAYQLQVRLQGPEALDICYLAIAAVLAELMDPEEEAREANGQELIDLDDANSLSDPTPSSSQDKGRFKCHFPGCGKDASRQADLDRHYKGVHLGAEHKTKHLCDYKKCERHVRPFFRQDHFRDHLRIYHKEDLLRRGTKADREWWASRAPRPIFKGWWRCSRCLVRVDLDANGFVCDACGSQCEKERQRYRLETPKPSVLPGEKGKGKGQSPRLHHPIASSGSSVRKRAASS